MLTKTSSDYTNLPFKYFGIYLAIIHDDTHDKTYNFVTGVQEHNTYLHQTHYRMVNLQSQYSIRSDKLLQ